jgi:2'-5' RNA ligase
MFSLNAPVPGEVKRLAGDLRTHLLPFDSVRESHTLVVKRLDDDAEGGRDRIEGQVRRALAGAPSFEARVTGIDAFEEPTAGPGPVVYLAVESPGLWRVHERLVDHFGAVEGLEGPEYTPHVTLARGGSPETAERLTSESIDPVTWTVSELRFFDARYRERLGRVALPA